MAADNRVFSRSWPPVAAGTHATYIFRSRVAGLLRQSPLPALRKLAVEETDESVLLLGSVSSYYLKQLAQETVMPLLDGRELQNRLTVVQSGR